MKNYLNVENNYSDDKLKEIANIIKNGGVVLFPTETVYGIGTNGLDAKAVEKIYEIKKRNKKNPINLLVSNLEMIEKVAQDISPLEYKLIKAFFPGPLTLILKKKNIVPDIVTAGSDFVGVRSPNNVIAKKLLDFSGVPIAAPSANISGNPSGTSFNTIINDFPNIDFAIDGGKSKIGIESTIVKVIDNIPHILRPGSITPEQIKEIAGNVILETNQNSNLPSSNIKHYQLNIDTCLVYSKDNDKMVNKIIELSKDYQTPVIVCCNENSELYSNINVITIASKNNLEEYSKNLFSSLQKAASLSPDCILIEGIKQEGLGIAIMNRLLNVCNNNYVEL